MTRVLRRPMFRLGGNTDQGIMSGVVPRQGYDNGGVSRRKEMLMQGAGYQVKHLEEIASMTPLNEYLPTGTRAQKITQSIKRDNRKEEMDYGKILKRCKWLTKNLDGVNTNELIQQLIDLFLKFII